MFKSIVVALVSVFLVVTGACADDEFWELAKDKSFDVVKALTKNASTIRQGLEKVEERVSMALPKSMLDNDGLDQLSKDTIKLNEFVPKPLSPLNNKDAIRRIGSGGKKSSGTLTGATDELQRLEQGASKRASEIDHIKKLRADIDSVRAQYVQTEKTARRLSDKIGKLASDPTIEFSSRLTGRSVAISWAEFEAELIPALQQRSAAAERALSRLDAVVSAAEKDLQGFNDSRYFANEIFAQIPGDATNMSPSAVPGPGSAKLLEISQRMEASTSDTLTLANRMREEAGKIRAWNAGVSQFQSMVNWLSFGMTGASGEPPKDDQPKWEILKTSSERNNVQLRERKQSTKQKPPERKQSTEQKPPG